jgi:hypothetical protein
MRTPLFVLLTILWAGASTVYLGAATRLPPPDNRHGNHLVTQKTTLSHFVTLKSMLFRVTSALRRKPKPPPTPPPTPTPTPPPTPGQVSLAWDLDNDSTVVGYNLYYTTNPTALTQAMHPPIPGTPLKISGMSSGMPTTTITLTGLSSGAVFYFGLTAYNVNGESLLSNVVWARVP